MKNKLMRKLMLCSLFMGSFMLLIEPVFAISCNGIMTQETADFIGEIFGYIQIFVPALLIVFGAVDFGTAVISEDKDALKKSGVKFTKRCICGVAVFFIPLIVKVLLDISGITGTLVDDPMCGMEDIVNIDEGGE